MVGPIVRVLEGNRHMLDREKAVFKVIVNAIAASASKSSKRVLRIDRAPVIWSRRFVLLFCEEGTEMMR